MAVFLFDFFLHGGVRRDGIDVETIADDLWLFKRAIKLVN